MKKTNCPSDAIMSIFSVNNTLQEELDAAAGAQFCSLDHNFELVKGTMISDSFKWTMLSPKWQKTKN